MHSRSWYEFGSVEEPIVAAIFSIYAKPGKKIPCNWGELVRSNLRIDYQRRVFYFETNLREHLSARIQGVEWITPGLAKKLPAEFRRIKKDPRSLRKK
ncbi:hypothetical protein DOM22_06835 [Bdellovibrio sp. ZAP7]|nr:hypothetical protein DOM22_06835 [Bdellovibrio sp. ZAP7]